MGHCVWSLLKRRFPRDVFSSFGMISSINCSTWVSCTGRPLVYCAELSELSVFGICQWDEYPNFRSDKSRCLANQAYNWLNDSMIVPIISNYGNHQTTSPCQTMQYFKNFSNSSANPPRKRSLTFAANSSTRWKTTVTIPGSPSASCCHIGDL